MNTAQLECFLSVARFLNFSKAAEEIKMSQPAVTHQIKTLEQELGVKLFKRTSRTVRLTREGFLFLHDAEQVLRITERAKQNLSARKESVLLSIGCHNMAEAGLLPPVLKKMNAHHKGFRPFIHMIPFESLTNLLENEQVDVMFGIKKAYKKTFLRYQELTVTPVACVCSKEHPLAQYSSLKTEQLTGTMILCEPRKIDDSIRRLQQEAADKIPFSERLFGDGHESMVTLLRAGLGFTLLPLFSASTDSDLAYIPMTDLPELSFGVYTRKGDGNPILKEFTGLLKEELLVDTFL